MKATFAILALVVAASLQAQPVPRCSDSSYRTLHVTSGSDVTLPVAAIAGAERYRVQLAKEWSFSGPSRFLMQGTIVEQTFNPGTEIHETFFNTRGDFPQDVYVAVIAEVPLDDGSKNLCAQDFLVEVAADPAIPLHSARVVVPVAGSVHGAFNSVFKTRIVLENRWADETISGHISFHRAGVPGASSDPFVTYSLEPHKFVAFDDVVGAMHLDGQIGSLDIVPDAASNGGYPLPQVRADLISIGANGGEFTASIPVVTPSSSYAGAVIGSPEFLVEPPRNKRINVGVRSLAVPVSIDAFLFAPDGTERARTTRSYAADMYEQTPLSSWFNDRQQPGDSMLFLVHTPDSFGGRAGAIVLLAETDNTTNDVTIVSPTDVDTIKQPVILCSSGPGCAVMTGFF